MLRDGNHQEVINPIGTKPTLKLSPVTN